MKFDSDKAVTRTEAMDLIFQNWAFKADTEVIPIQQALGCVTAQNIYSENILPVYRTSMLDDIAVRSADFVNGLPETSKWSRGVEYVQADTGDDFPDSYDTVIAAEDVNYNSEGQLCLSEGFKFKQGDCVRRAGTMVAKGELLMEAHIRLTPVHLAILAMGGIFQVEVIKKPRVVYIPTGNELIPAGIKPERGQNIEANSLMVASFLQQWGAEPICYPIIKDKPAELEQTLDSALAVADIVLINGGSSRGTEDFNATLLQKKASFFRHGIKAVPGRPVAIAILGGKPVVNLPGPMVATFLAMDWCVSGLVHCYYGLPLPQRPKIKVKLESELKKKPDFESFTRLILHKKDGGYSASSVGHDKSVPYSMLKANAMLISPIGVSGYQAGDEIEVELLWGLENLK